MGAWPQAICLTMRSSSRSLLLALLGFSLFAGLAVWRAGQSHSVAQPAATDRVVIAAPILLPLYAGDPYLAANLESMRLAATGLEGAEADADYLIRAQQVVARLNPCHEDNYYLANGLLTWGGAVSEGNQILRSAMECRFWDGIPPFFYGVNQMFFNKDVDEAERAFRLAAELWPANRSALLKLAVMVRANTFADENAALDYLIRQRDATRDAQLRVLLDQRVTRLRGLIELRAAQERYEKVHGHLESLQQLVDSGELKQLPVDPLRLGYELRNGQIDLKKLKIAGMEEQP